MVELGCFLIHALYVILTHQILMVALYANTAETYTHQQRSLSRLGGAGFYRRWRLISWMGNIINIEDQKPHVRVTGLKTQHVIPVELLNNIASGKIKVSEVDFSDDFIPTLIKEWLITAKSHIDPNI